ncbi:MAG: hypothetical protein FWH02_08605 [Oscillospiraceae bacterium]|nr:hypothetical protein [Oscillospiraceae bacterium]
MIIYAPRSIFYVRRRAYYRAFLYIVRRIIGGNNYTGRDMVRSAVSS